MKLARSVTVNLCVISARANYLILSVTTMHRHEGGGTGADEWQRKVLLV